MKNPKSLETFHPPHFEGLWLRPKSSKSVEKFNTKNEEDVKIALQLLVRLFNQPSLYIVARNDGSGWLCYLRVAGNPTINVRHLSYLERLGYIKFHSSSKDHKIIHFVISERGTEFSLHALTKHRGDSLINSRPTDPVHCAVRKLELELEELIQRKRAIEARTNVVELAILALQELDSVPTPPE